MTFKYKYDCNAFNIETSASCSIEPHRYRKTAYVSNTSSIRFQNVPTYYIEHVICGHLSYYQLLTEQIIYTFILYRLSLRLFSITRKKFILELSTLVFIPLLLLTLILIGFALRLYQGSLVTWEYGDNF